MLWPKSCNRELKNCIYTAEVLAGSKLRTNYSIIWHFRFRSGGASRSWELFQQLRSIWMHWVKIHLLKIGYRCHWVTTKYYKQCYRWCKGPLSFCFAEDFWCQNIRYCETVLAIFPKPCNVFNSTHCLYRAILNSFSND